MAARATILLALLGTQSSSKSNYPSNNAHRRFYQSQRSFYDPDQDPYEANRELYRAQHNFYEHRNSHGSTTKTVANKTNKDQISPFVVVFGFTETIEMPTCTGSIISPEWVLTAAHCVVEDERLLKQTKVYYGDISCYPNVTFSRKVLKGYPHHNWKFQNYDFGFRKYVYSYRNDIGLLHIERLAVRHIGQISAIDFSTLTGRRVRYIGGGLNSTNITNAMAANYQFIRRLQISEALIVKCEKKSDDFRYIFRKEDASLLCVRPKCNRTLQGISHNGGPVIYRKKIVGIACCLYGESDVRYTAVSPYIEWIQETITRNSFSLR